MNRLFKMVLIAVMSLLLVVTLDHLPGFSRSGSQPDQGHVAYAALIKVTTMNLNLRSGPGNGYSILLTMPKGSSVTVLGTSGGWSKVTYQGTTGYAYSSNLASAAGTGYYTTGSLNLRSGPGTGYAILLTMPKGSGVTVLGTSGSWSKVIYQGTTGYAYSSNLASSVGTRYYTTGALNLRTGPGTGYSIILTMSRGSAVTVYSISNNWARLSYSGKTGYASMAYLSKTAPSSSGALQPGQTVIGLGSSHFAESEVARSKNIRVATGRLNGVVIQPGETLSVLRVIKAPTLANGYYMSKVYSGDSLVDGIGGGVCQVSSTLYNAVLRAGLKIVDRSTHRFSVFYLPYGMDATIYAPSTDLQFKNTLDHPITIKGTAISGQLTFSLISDEDAMNGYSYKFYQTNIVEGDRHWRIEYTSQLDKGETEILVYPHPEASVTVYRKTYRYGTLIRTEFWDAVSYRELVGVKRVGI